MASLWSKISTAKSCDNLKYFWNKELLFLSFEKDLTPNKLNGIITCFSSILNFNFVAEKQKSTTQFIFVNPVKKLTNSFFFIFPETSKSLYVQRAGTLVECNPTLLFLASCSALSIESNSFDGFPSSIL